MKKYLKKPPGPRVRGIVFDLDDTLYLEREYVRSGFIRVAQEVERLTGATETSVFSFLWGVFEQGHRGNTFDRFLTAHPNVANRLKVDDLVKIYRDHKPKLEPLPGVVQLIAHLRDKGFCLGLLSDGAFVGQQAKVSALNLSALLEPVILTDAWGPEFWKPHPRGYETIARAWNLAPQELMYVGDNPLKDFAAPNKLGWRTVRLRLPGQERFEQEAPSADYAPQMEIDDLEGLPTSEL